MGNEIPDYLINKLEQVLHRMELKLNKEKSKLIDAKDKSLDYLGFTIRYDKDLYGRDKRYWNIIPSKKSSKKMRENIKTTLKTLGNKSPEKIVYELNIKIRGWINYFTIPNVSYPQKAKRDLRYYLSLRLQRYYSRKSQRKSKLFRRKAFDVLVHKYGLIDPSKYSYACSL